MFKMINPVRDYAWGSTTAFSELFGWAASATPRAEIWMGAHPSDPSCLELGAESSRTMPAAQAAEADRAAGTIQAPDATRPREAPRACGEVISLPDYLREAEELPDGFSFLLKVLAADRPLSIQSHPTADRARRGFAAEEAAGIAADAPHRSYKDPNAKPELIVALTEFSALCGFRPYPQASKVLTSLRAALALTGGSAQQTRLPGVLDRLQGFVEAQDYRAALEHLLGSGRTEVEAAAQELHELLQFSTGSAEQPAADLGESLDPGTREMLLQVSAAFPADPGIFVTLLLNQVRLQPGESIYLPAGNLHAYLHGVGVELMGNSDNVLRGGLTSKHLDVEELLRVTDWEVLPVPHCPVRRSGSAPSRARYQAPFPEFQLESLEFPGETVLEGAGCAIVLCTAGELTLGAPSEPEIPVQDPAVTGSAGTSRMLTLRPGESAFLPDPTGHRLSALAHAQAFVAHTTSVSPDQEHPRP